MAFTRIAPPPDNGCAACASLNAERAFCPAHRQSRTCRLCGDRGFHTKDMRWVRCAHEGESGNAE